MNALTPITIRQLPDATSLDVARNRRLQSLEALQTAIAEWWASAGAGESHAIDRRWVRRALSDFRWDEKHYYATWRETVGNRRMA
jgi:hypothetical protein